MLKQKILSVLNLLFILVILKVNCAKNSKKRKLRNMAEYHHIGDSDDDASQYPQDLLDYWYMNAQKKRKML